MWLMSNEWFILQSYWTSKRSALCCIRNGNNVKTDHVCSGQYDWRHRAIVVEIIADKTFTHDANDQWFSFRSSIDFNPILIQCACVFKFSIRHRSHGWVYWTARKYRLDEIGKVHWRESLQKIIYFRWFALFFDRLEILLCGHACYIQWPMDLPSPGHTIVFNFFCRFLFSHFNWNWKQKSAERRKKMILHFCLSVLKVSRCSFADNHTSLAVA